MDPMERRPATPEEAKALANPLRLRILRLTLDESLTNKQLAERLGRDPGTVLHHVRQLVRTGFLVPDEVRQGERGALEKPYRSTGKSWTLSVGDTPAEPAASQAMLEAFLAELAEAGPDAAAGFDRAALTLNRASREELETRVVAILDEYAARPPDPDGEPYGLFFAMHRRAQPAPRGHTSGRGGVTPRS